MIFHNLVLHQPDSVDEILNIAFKFEVDRKVHPFSSNFLTGCLTKLDEDNDTISDYLVFLNNIFTYTQDNQLKANFLMKLEKESVIDQLLDLENHEIMNHEDFAT